MSPSTESTKALTDSRGTTTSSQEFTGTFSGITQHLSVMVAGKRMAPVSVQLLRHRTTLPLKSFHWKAEDSRWSILPADTSLCLGGKALADVLCRLTLVCASEEHPLQLRSTDDPKAPSTVHTRRESTEYLQNLLGLWTLTSCPVAMSIAV